MSEMGGNYDPGPWKGWDFDSARKPHVDATAGRSYSNYSPPPSVSNLGGGLVVDPASQVSGEQVPDSLETDAASPLVVVVDGTGSMGEYPETIFKKLPLLDDGVKDYLDDCQISYAMVGDAGHDRLPLQIQPFGKGKQMVEALNKLVIEGGGGGNQMESYDLAAAYYANNVQMPKATKPVIIFICDEGVYPNIDKNWAEKYAKLKMEKAHRASTVFEQLKAKFSIYCIRKHYTNAGPALDGDKLIGANLHIHQQWENLVGADRVVILNEPGRVVDVILGLLAYETGKMDFFKKELTFRQTPEQVKTVMKTMVTLGKGAKSVHTGLSIARRPDDGKTQGSKSLI